MATAKARKAERKPEPREVAVTIHVKDSDGKKLGGIHVELKCNGVTAYEGFANKHGEIECTGLISGEDYKVFINNEEIDEIEAPRGDDEQEIEYDGDYKPNVRGDDDAEPDPADEDGDPDDEDDLDSTNEDADELEMD